MITPCAGLLAFFAATVAAHAPYAVKEKELPSPQGTPLLLERLHGDGIFGPDPVSLHLRTPEGAVLAHTPVNQFVAVFCPSLRSCWAFPHNALIPVSRPWRLDFDHLDYAKRPPPDLRLKEGRGVVRGFGNPIDRTEALGFVADGSVAGILAGPVVVIGCPLPFLAVLALVSLFPYGVARAFAPAVAARQGAARMVLQAVSGLLYLFWGLALLPLGLLTLGGAAPWLYSALAVGLSLWAGSRFLTRPPERSANPL